MNKLAAADVNLLLVKSASTIESLFQENQQLRAKVAVYERGKQAEKVASLAQASGIIEEEETESYTRSLVENGEDLASMEALLTKASKGVGLGSVPDLDKTASAYDDEEDPFLSKYERQLFS